uniref:Integrase catalytic domain-containing protein n=1 Tax=Tanacetum cinerariifolium TaxID=118510 RepID=A0A699H827_TANCI|nr:hypothetical protein [Tanacetum cinerariifolium]
MSTQQDIYAVGSESRPPMLNKENYMPWSSRLLRYAKSRPNGKLIHNSIINGPYVRRMIPGPGDTNLEVLVNETFHVQTDDELTEKKLKQIEADDQAIQTILFGLPEDIYAAVDSCETAQEIWLQVQQMMKGSNIGIQEKKAKLFNEWERFTSNEGESIESYYHCFLKLMNDLKRNKHFLEKITSNLKFLNNLQPKWSRHVTIVHQTKDLNTTDYTQLYDFMKYNQKEVDELKAKRLAKTQDPLALTTTSKNPYNFPNVGNQNGLIGVPENVNQNLNGNGNHVAARAEGNAAGHNGIQLQAEEFDLMTVAVDLDKIKEVNANCILMANLQQASTSGTQTNKAPIYDSDGSAEVHNYENYYDNEIFNMLTQEEQYTELLEPILELHQVSQNDNDTISKDFSVEQSGETVEQHPTNFEETRALYDSLYQNLAIEVEKVNTVNRKLKETNADLTTELARFKNQENSGKQIMTLNEELSDLNKQLSKEKSTVSFLLEEKKKLKSEFKIREDELLDKQIQHEKKIKELDNILVKTGQSIQTIHMLSPKPDSFYHTEHKMALGYQNPFYLKQAQKKQQSLYDGKVLLEKHDPPIVNDLKETLQLARENISNMANVSKSISIPNEEFFDDTTPSVARKFLNEVKSTIVTLQCVVKHRMTLETHNWSFSAHQELHKIVKDENFPIVNQVDARVQNFEIQFLKEAAKFVGDFKSLAKEANESLAKHKALELEIERLLRAVISQDIMCVVQNASVVDTSNLQTELERKPPMFGKTHAFSKPVTSNSIPTPQESKVVKNDKVIAPGMFRINPFKTSREEKHVPNNVRTSARTKPITVSQPPVITKKDVNSDSNGLSSIGIDNTKTRRPQPRSNTKNDRVPSASKSSRSKNKGIEVEEHHRNLLFSKNTKHMSSACNNIKLATQKVVCAMCKQCLISVNHDECLLNFVNDMNSHGCSKHMTRNLKLLINFVWKFMGTIRFENDHVATILGFSDLQWGNILITRVYFIEGLGHNLFSVGQFCDSDLESWLWHQRLFLLNFDTINDLAKNDLVSGLPKFKYHKEHLCPSCEQGKRKRASHPPKPVPNSRQRLHLLHMDLCGPMRISSINGKRITVLLQSPVIIIRTDNGTEFKNQVLKEYFDSVGISHQVSSVRTHQQDGVVERRNRTLVEAARTMLIFSRAPLFLWDEAIATTRFTQNRSIIHRRFNKTPYELINGRKPDISFLHVFGALCYPKNDREDIRKLGAKGDIGFFIGYSADFYTYRVYNRRTKKIMETMNVSFDEVSTMAFEHRSSKPRHQSMTSGQISSGLDLTYAPLTITTQQPTEGELDLLFESMYDDHIGGQPSATARTILAAQEPQVHQTSTRSTSIADTAPTPTNLSSQATNFPNTSQNVDELNSQQQHVQEQGIQAHL